MSHFGRDSNHSNGDVSSKVHANDNDNVSSVPIGNATIANGNTIHPNVREGEAKSPLPIPFQGVVDIDSKTIVVQVLVLCSVNQPSSFPLKKHQN